MCGTLYSFQSICTNTFSIGLIGLPQNPEGYIGSAYCDSEFVNVHVIIIIFLLCTEDSEAQMSFMSDSDN